MKKLVVGLTGASGSAYFLGLMEELAKLELTVHVIATKTGSQVFEYETGKSLVEEVERWNREGKATVVLEDVDDLFSKVASGSYKAQAMVIVPCSMSTLGELAGGIATNLLTRSADVMIKEKRPLILVPRETPLSSIHLRNMAKLFDAGATILAAMPGFYTRPETLKDVVDFIVGKILDALGIENQMYHRWEGREKE